MSQCIRLYADPVQIKACRDKIKVHEKSIFQLANVLTLAGNDVRLKILYLLTEEGELCPCDLSDILGMSIPAVSQHLRKLKDGNIIQFRKEGQTIYYRISPVTGKLLNPVLKLLKNINIPEAI